MLVLAAELHALLLLVAGGSVFTVSEGLPQSRMLGLPSAKVDHGYGLLGPIDPCTMLWLGFHIKLRKSTALEITQRIAASHEMILEGEKGLSPSGEAHNRWLYLKHSDIDDQSPSRGSLGTNSNRLYIKLDSAT